MNRLRFKTLLAIGLSVVISCSAYAETTAYITLANDYLFKGQSLTNEKPAISASVDYNHDSGWYVGSWLSNVDFLDADAELDLYTGYGWQVNDQLNLNVGVVSYSYFGDIKPSHKLNYGEVYLQATVADNWQFGYWFAPDYIGSGEKHSIILLAYSYEFYDNTELVATTNLLYNHDDKKYYQKKNIQGSDQSNNKSYYNHLSLAVNYQLNQLTLQLALESHNDNYKGAWQGVTPYFAITYSF